MSRRYVVTAEYRFESSGRAGGVAASTWQQRFRTRWRARDYARRHFIAGAIPTIVDARTGGSIPLF